MGLTAIYCPYVLGIHKKALLGRDTSTPIWLVNKVRKSFGRGDTAIQRLINTLTIFFKWAIHGLFLFIFDLFKQTLQFFQQICVKKCPSSIWCRDSNPQPSERESLPTGSFPVLVIDEH